MIQHIPYETLLRALIEKRGRALAEKRRRPRISEDYRMACYIDPEFDEFDADEVRVLVKKEGERD